MRPPARSTGSTARTVRLSLLPVALGLLAAMGSLGETRAYAPSNDSFASASALAGWSGATRAWGNEDATREDGEPVHAGTGGGHSIWYQWTPATSGPATIATSGSTFDTVVAVYTGRRVNRLTDVASDDDGAGSEVGTSIVRFQAAAGTTYYIAVDGSGPATGRVELSWNRPPPANDTLARAQTLTGTSGSVAASNEWATGEVGEPYHDNDLTWRSVWYRWIAPSDLAMSFDTIGSAISPRFEIFTGATLAGLTWVGGGGGVERPTAVHVTGGTSYVIRVEESDYRDVGEFVLNWRVIDPPPNDDFADAQPIGGADGSLSATGFGASMEAGEPFHYASGHGEASTVWYRWTSPLNARVVFTLDVGRPMAAYTGTDVASLTRLASDRGSSDTDIEFDVVSGGRYSIAVDTSTDFALAWRYVTPQNDFFANRTHLDYAGGSVDGYNASASAEAGEPRHAGVTSARSIWYGWYSSMPGTLTLTTSGSTFDTVLAVYSEPATGERVDSLTAVASNDNDGTSRTSRVTVRAVPGTHYAIALDGAGGAVGNTALTWSFKADPPPNDNFAAAQQITGLDGTVAGRTHSATTESGEPAHAGAAGGRSIWFRWTARDTGRAAFLTYPAETNTLLAVYTGTQVGSLTAVASNNDYPGVLGGSRVDFSTKAGTTYFIAVDTVAAAEAHVALSWTTPPANDLFEHAQPLLGRSGTETGTSTRSTLQAYEPYFSREGGGASVWYRWTAPASEVVQFTADASGSAPTIALFVGERLQKIEPVPAAGEVTADSRLVFRFVARAGTTYRIQVEDAWGPFTLDWKPASAPANDNLGRAAVISGDTGTASVRTSAATTEFGEPFHHPLYGRDRTVWYTYTAGRDGTLALDTTGSTFATVVSAYTGSDLAALTRVVTHHNTLDPPRTLVRLGVRAGQTYRIVVGGNGSAGDLVLNWRLTGTPANDNWSTATALTGSHGSVTRSNVAASREPGEPRHAGSGDAAASLWYRWTAPASGSVSFDTAGSRFDTLLGIYRGTSVSALAPVRVSDNAGVDILTSRVQFNATAGTTYYVAVDTATSVHTGADGHSGDIVLNWHAPATPPNDAFAAATVLNPGGYGGFRILLDSEDNVGATAEAGEPSHGGLSGGRSIWYRWIAPTTERFSVHTRGTAFDTAIAVYTGSSIEALSLVAADDNSAGGTASRVSFSAVHGTTYWIAIDGRSGANGDVVLSLNLANVPLNDHFRTADALTGASGTVYGTTALASEEYGEPSHGWVAESSVWYRWTAPSNGTFSFQLGGFSGTGYPQLAAYTGTAVDGLSALSQVEGTSVRIGAVAGSTYHIAVDDGHSGAFSFQLRWAAATAPSNDNLGSAAPLTGSSGTVTTSTTGASRQPAEPAHAARLGGASVWYTWKAPVSGVTSFTTAGSRYDTTLAVYTGTSTASLVLRASNDDAGTLQTSSVRFAAVAGTTYQIAVDGNNTGLIGSGAPTGSVTLAWRVDAPPANDGFAAAPSLSGSSGSVTGTTLGARTETGEPRHADTATGASVWYAWTAPSTGAVTFDTARSTTRSIVAVYSGTSVTALSVAGRSDDLGPHAASYSFATRVGTTYRIAVDGVGGAAGPIALDWRMAPPANDAFASARVISGRTGTSRTPTATATKETGEPTHAGNAGARSVWFRWTAPATESVTLHTSGSSFNTLLGVYTGTSVSALTPVASSDNAAGVTTSLLKFEARSGVTYMIAVDGYAAATGDAVLTWHPTPDPPNNFFAEAQVLSGRVGGVPGTTFDANRETGEPVHAGVTGAHSVWYRWLAPITGTATISTSESRFDPTLAVYTGSSPGSLVRVAADNDSGGYGEAVVTFPVTANREYRIAVDGVSASMGAFHLTWSVPPANDDFADALALTGDTGTVSGDTIAATGEPFEPEVQPYNETVWFTWTATSDGAMTFTPRSTEPMASPVVTVYVGDTLETLVAAGPQYNGKVRMAVTAGTVYRIQLIQIGGSTYTLAWARTATPPNDNFRNAQPISGASGNISGTAAGATHELGEPTHDHYGAAESVWYRWTAPATGAVGFEVHAPWYSPVIGVYRGTDVASLTPEPIDFRHSWAGSDTDHYTHARFNAVAGETYYIAVDSTTQWLGGGFQLSWAPSPPP